MTPKEKAKELVNKHWTLCYDKHDINKLTKEDAKKCALIAVYEVMSALTYLPYGLDYLNKICYWEEVKQEIEKL